MIENISEAKAKKILKSKKAKGKPEKLKKEKGRMIDGQFYPAMASGGRIGLRAGSKGCKLAMKGKGRAYGKNS